MVQKQQNKSEPAKTKIYKKQSAIVNKCVCSLDHSNPISTYKLSRESETQGASQSQHWILNRMYVVNPTSWNAAEGSFQCSVTESFTQKDFLYF